MTLSRLIAVLALVGANAFFVAAEFSLVAIRRTRVQELIDLGSRRALSAQKAIQQLDLMLSGTQLGITFSSLGLGWIGEPALASLFEGIFSGLPYPFSVTATHGTAVAIAFGIITFLHVTLGELVPKNLAISVPESTALWVATPMRVFTYLFRPVIWLFNETANRILKATGVQPSREIVALHTPDELALIIEQARAGGTIEREHSKILTRTLEFPEKRAVDAMLSRTEVEAVSADDGVDDVMAVSERTGYSRFPVWKDRPDEFVGVVHLKDILRAAKKNPDATAKNAMRDPLLVPESLHLEEVLIRMRQRRNHFAIVLDEFGSTAGILTMEDILEELVGEIRDEYDFAREKVRKVEGGIRVPGNLRLDELFEVSGCQLPNGEYETVAGFILDRLGRLAKRGDEVEVDGWDLRVVNVRRRRIVSIDLARKT